MPHLDDATIHTLLDRELDSAEQQAVESHLAECEQCAARLAEERSIVSGAEELIASLDEPPRETSAVSSETSAVSSEQEEARRAPASGAAFLHPSAEPRGKGPPVVLIPEGVPAGWLPRRRWPLAAAALLVVAGGAGWLVFRPSEPTAVAAGAESLALDTVTDAEEAAMSAAIMRAPAGLPVGDTAFPDTSRQVASAPPAASDTPATQEFSNALPINLAVGVTGGSSSTADEQQVRLRAQAAEVARAESTTLAIRESLLAVERARDSLAQLAQRQSDDSARQALAIRNAEATELRRAEAQRRDAAEVALESPPPQPVARPTAGAAAAARDEVTTRQRVAPAPRMGPIGLDEAADLLGQPVHVIDGMRFNSVSLVPGSSFPGADAGRPVVRVTYVGVDGGIIYLDQQRLLDGSGEGDTEEVFRASGWYIGSVRLRLMGDVTHDSLAVLVGKVR